MLRGQPDAVPQGEFWLRFALRITIGIVVVAVVWTIAVVRKYRVGFSDKTMICPKCG